MFLKSLLDPQVRKFYGDRLDKIPDSFPGADQMRMIADLSFNDRIHREDIYFWKDDAIITGDGSIPVRIYQSGPVDDGLRPVVLFFHGGGFVIHNIRSHDDLCRRIANKGDCVVVSVGYRLAPENPWPACMEDGWEALKWLSEHCEEIGGDSRRICLMGDSAGATICAELSRISRDSNGPSIALQILCYGIFGVCEDSDSMRAFGQGGFVLPQKNIEWFMKQFKAESLPGQASDLTDLPPTFCITAECDPLRDDGESFAGLLAASGNQVEIRRVSGMMHGFLLYWYLFDRAGEVVTDIGKRIAEV